MFCPNCGTQVSPDLRFCPTCGAVQPAQGGSIPSPQVPPVPYAPAAPFVPPAEANVQIGKWIGESWNMVTSDIAMFAVMAIVVLVLGSVVPIVLNGPLTCGCHIAIIQKMRTGRLDIGDMFKGFNFFVPALVAAILIGVFVFFGMLFCLIPALVVGAIYLFPYMFIIDKRMDFWPAMQASHEVVKKNYFGFVMFVLAIIGVNLLGLLALVVGLLVTIPMTWVAITVAYRDLVGLDPNTNF